MKKTNIYIGKEVEDAIIEYCNLDPNLDARSRDKLFAEIIYPALNTLVSNLIYDRLKQGRPYYCETSYEDLKIETISYLYERLQLFDPNRGKAFSFLNRTAYNYILSHSQKVYKNTQMQGELTEVDANRDLVLEQDNINNLNTLREFFQIWTTQSVNNIDKMYENERDRKIADAILRLFENVHFLNIYYKKALILMIKEQVSYPTLYITNVINDLRTNFNFKYKEHLKRHGKKR